MYVYILCFLFLIENKGKVFYYFFHRFSNKNRRNLVDHCSYDLLLLVASRTASFAPGMYFTFFLFYNIMYCILNTEKDFFALVQ